MLWKYLIIYLATESCQTVSCNSSCTSRRSSFFLGGLLRGRFQGWNRSQWWVVHRGGLRVDGAVPRVAVHNGPVGSCSTTCAGATQFGAPYAGVCKQLYIIPATSSLTFCLESQRLLFQIRRAWGNPHGVWVLGIRESHIASLAFGKVLISALVLKWRCTVKLCLDTLQGFHETLH